MKTPTPNCSDTIVDRDNHVWIPTSFSDFLLELNHLTIQCSGEDPLPLFRGHAESRWLLESTIARSCKRFILGLDRFSKIPKHVQDSIDYHRVVLNLLLLKYGVIVRPDNENDQHIDTWYELMREFQQYPERDLHHFRGTFFLDWSKLSDVALFFANLNREGDGALWICDAVATGKTLQIKPVGEILDSMDKLCNKAKPDAPGCPLIFHPPMQTPDKRVLRQQAVYIAQMDLRIDLASIWIEQEVNNSSEQIFVKLILPNGTQDDCNTYLMSKGIDYTYLFPEF
jgi:hypothetical protein